MTASRYGHLEEQGDRVQCHICRRWYKALIAHIRVHGLTAPEYRAEFGLRHTNSLSASATVEKWRDGSIRQTNRGNGAAAAVLRGDPEALEQWKRVQPLGKQIGLIQPRQELRDHLGWHFVDDKAGLVGSILVAEHSHACSWECGESLLKALRAQGYAIQFRHSVSESVSNPTGSRSGHEGMVAEGGFDA